MSIAVPDHEETDVNILKITNYAKDQFFDLHDSAVILGDAKEVLSLLPDNFIQCTVCSPPYWGLRDYGINDQLGAENDLNDYISHLVDIFSEVKRVLRNDGLLWLNIGDSYTSGDRKYRGRDKKTDTRTDVRAMSYRPDTPKGLKPKDLIGIPWKLAFALQQTGWYLRADIIWHKPNCLPESVKDRPTKCHEYIFLLSKSDKYYYDYRSVMEPSSTTGKLRNKRTVWSVNTQAFNGNHFSTFPPDLILPCIKSGSKPGNFVLDPFFGSGTVGVVSNQLDRKFIGIDINIEYIEMAYNRVLSENKQ